MSRKLLNIFRDERSATTTDLSKNAAPVGHPRRAGPSVREFVEIVFERHI
jgi:hypothetical protein